MRYQITSPTYDEGPRGAWAIVATSPEEASRLAKEQYEGRYTNEYNIAIPTPSQWSTNETGAAVVFNGDN